MTAGLIAAIPFFAEINNLRESQRVDLRMRIKYPDQNVHLMVPRMRDLKRIVTENGEESKCRQFALLMKISDIFKNDENIATYS